VIAGFTQSISKECAHERQFQLTNPAAARTHFAEQIAGSKWSIRDHGDAAPAPAERVLGFSFISE
jgi:hypothetical protein